MTNTTSLDHGPEPRRPEPRASRALGALGAAERVSATAVPSPTLARRSHRRTKPCGAPRPQSSRHVRRAPRRGQRPRSRPNRPPRQNAELAKPPNGPSKASPNPATPNPPTRNAPTRQSRVRTTAPGAPMNAPKPPSAAPTNAPEPPMPPRKRLTVALSNFPARSPALQAPDQPQASVTAAPQYKRLACRAAHRPPAPLPGDDRAR